MAVLYSGLLSDRPTASTEGNVFLPTDGVYIYRDDGAAWQAWGPAFPMIAPDNDAFSWVNQGACTIDTTGGFVNLTIAAEAAWNNHARIKTAPGTPYTVTAAFMFGQYNADHALGGLCWRQSSDGKLVTLQYGQALQQIAVYKFTDPTTLSAAYDAVPQSATQSEIIFLRIEDDGVDRICYWSYDGQHWIQLHSVGRTDFLTADQVGFFVGANNATYPAMMTLLHWVES